MDAVLKPYVPIPQLIDHLQARGMKVADVSYAERCLNRIGYYRFCSYSHAFRNIQTDGGRLENFFTNTTFEDVIDFYVFDKRLRHLFLDALERIEVCFRGLCCAKDVKRGPPLSLNALMPRAL
jgi:abortive infection bacteriophage resistance protein